MRGGEGVQGKGYLIGFDALRVVVADRVRHVSGKMMMMMEEKRER